MKSEREREMDREREAERSREFASIERWTDTADRHNENKRDEEEVYS